MCGISGVITREPVAANAIRAVSRMSAAQAHRGPDGCGDYRDTHAILAARRLSIIDLAGGAQPLYNEDRSLALVANAEIYNFVELRQRLRDRGHRFATGSDCETILHLYEEHGTGCVEHLRGMFAFALWDSRRRRLLLARDRMGEKPLYLYERDGRLLFASELKGLLRSGLVSFELDPPALHLYFHFQYVPEPATPLAGVRKLEAAHLLTLDVDSWRVEERRYWRMEDAPPIETAEPAELIGAELERCCELVTRADVPIGVALSGGIDSGGVAALAARRYPGAMRAFTVGYAGHPESDERADARALARHLEMPFDEVELETSAVVADFPELVYRRDDPIADIAGHGYYSVMKLARERGVKVVLQGQGGDELFWGYPLLRQSAFESKQKAALSEASPRALSSYLRFKFAQERSWQGLARWSRSCGGLRSGWRRFRELLSGPPDQMVFYDLSPDFRAARDIRRFYRRPFAERVNGTSPAELWTFNRPWPDVDVTLTRLVCDTYLRENGIAQADRLSMAASVEVRLPLVDHRLVEVVIGLRKVRSDAELLPKAWLREALRGALPEWAMNRPKRGFTPPTRDWHDAIFVAHGDSLRDGYLVQSGVLTPKGGRQLATGSFPEGITSPLSFKALVLEQWCRRMSSAAATSDEAHAAC